MKGKHMNAVMQQNSPRTCAIYARSATSCRDSIEAQISRCRAEAQDQGWTVDGHVVISDEGFGGHSLLLQRPGLQNLLNTARSGSHPFHLIIVDEVCRIGRNPESVLSILEAFSSVDITFHVVGQDNAQSIFAVPIVDAAITSMNNRETLVRRVLALRDANGILAPHLPDHKWRRQ
jgi:DNA invertase Pin-like site-specific DNA recombinase